MIGKDPRPGEDHINRTREYVRILLPALREVARRNGYALAVHGSLERDIDLIAVPWRDSAVGASYLVTRMFEVCKVVTGAVWPGQEGDAVPVPETKPCGRLAWAIRFPGDEGGPYIDLSVMPPPPAIAGTPGAKP